MPVIAVGQYSIIRPICLANRDGCGIGDCTVRPTEVVGLGGFRMFIAAVSVSPVEEKI